MWLSTSHYQLYHLSGCSFLLAWWNTARHFLLERFKELAKGNACSRKWLLGFWLNKPTNINLSPITWMSVDPENCWKNPPTAARSSICLWCGGAFKLNQGVLSLVSTLTTKPVISLPVETLHTHSDEDIKKGKADTHTHTDNHMPSLSLQWFSLYQENSWVCCTHRRTISSITDTKKPQFPKWRSQRRQQSTLDV